jgi:hypothetical protein
MLYFKHTHIIRSNFETYYGYSHFRENYLHLILVQSNFKELIHRNVMIIDYINEHEAKIQTGFPNIVLII